MSAITRIEALPRNRYGLGTKKNPYTGGSYD